MNSTAGNVVGLALIPVSLWVRAVVLAWGWNAYAVALGAPPIGKVFALGLSLFVFFAAHGTRKPAKDDRTLLEASTSSIVSSLLVWGLLALIWWWA